MKALLQLLYLGWWFLRARFFGRRKPLQSVVFVTNGCDSTCRHCVYCSKAEGSYFKPFAEIVKDLAECYGQGARMLDIEGVAASGKYCTMCGPDFCSVRLSNKLKGMKD